MKILCFEIKYVGFFKSNLEQKIIQMFRDANQYSQQVGGVYHSPLVEAVKYYREKRPGTALLDAKHAVEKIMAKEGLRG